jgi:hypothetical protein
MARDATGPIATDQREGLAFKGLPKDQLTCHKKRESTPLKYIINAHNLYVHQVLCATAQLSFLFKKEKKVMDDGNRIPLEPLNLKMVGWLELPIASFD